MPVTRAHDVAVVGKTDTAMAQEADVVIPYDSGAIYEVPIVAVVLAAAEAADDEHRSAAAKLRSGLFELPEVLARTLSDESRNAEARARGWLHAQHIYVLGAGPLAPLAYKVAMSVVMENIRIGGTYSDGSSGGMGQPRRWSGCGNFIVLLGTDASRPLTMRTIDFCRAQDSVMVYDAADFETCIRCSPRRHELTHTVVHRLLGNSPGDHRPRRAGLHGPQLLAEGGQAGHDQSSAHAGGKVAAVRAGHDPPAAARQREVGMTSSVRPEVCVIGNLNVDLILRGLPDLPAWGTEVVASSRVSVSSGQAGYLAMALGGLGVRVGLVANVGRDVTGSASSRISRRPVSLRMTSSVEVDPRDLPSRSSGSTASDHSSLSSVASPRSTRRWLRATRETSARRVCSA